MSETLAVQSSYGAVLNTLRAQDRLSSITAPAYSNVSKHWVAADYVVDLGKAYQDAQSNGARSLEVFADTVTIPDKFVAVLGSGSLVVLSIISRDVQLQGSPAVTELIDAATAPRSPAVRVLADTIKGDLQVQLTPKAGGSTSTAPIEAADGQLLFCGYTIQDGALVKTAGGLPLDMLSVGEPLYQVLVGSFDLAAGALIDNANTGNLELGRAVLRWLSRWSTYPTSDLAQLCRAATALGQLLPTAGDDGQFVHAIPTLAADACFAVFKSQIDVAEKYELDQSFQDIHADFRQVVGKVVGAWIQRDHEDATALQNEIDAANAIVAATQKALKQAAADLADRKLEFALEGIELNTEIKLDRINKIVKATFDIVKAVVEIGIGIAMIVVGDPAGLAGAAADIGEIKGTAQMIATVDAPIAEKAKNMFQLFYTEPLARIAKGVWQDRELLAKGFKVAAPGAVSAYEAATILSKIELPLDDLNKVQETMTQVGELIDSTVNVPNPVTSKAIWDSFEAEAVNQLDAIIGDKDSAKAVTEAALKYKTAVQKVAIYGRAQSEQQALLAQATRSLGTLIIEQGALIQKKAALTTLTQDLSRQEEMLQILQDSRANRLRDLRRAAYVSLSNFRAAYFYENLAWPDGSVALASSVNDLKEQAAAATLALEKRTKNLRSPHAEKVFDQPELLNEIRERLGTTITFPLTGDKFAEDQRVRLSEVYVWLDGVKAIDPATPITVELQAAQFRDRSVSEHGFAFAAAQPVRIRFAYRDKRHIESKDLMGAVPPTPFATWSLHVHNKAEELDFTGFKSVTVEIFAKSEAN
ncbi:MAG: hypothetical protein IPK16_08715 [Anaerolineales bacterium]|nr:hypothetical protein [Anaerolineales bacterium]